MIDRDGRTDSFTHSPKTYAASARRHPTRFARALAATCVLLAMSSRDLAQFVLPPTSPSMPTSFTPTIHGSWSPVYDWSSFIPGTPPGGGTANHHEFGHALLIPTGSHRGHVLLWHFDLSFIGAPSLTNQPTTWSFWWDPASPTQLNVITQSLSDDVFCSGTSWRPDGTLLVAGGLQATPTGFAPRASYVFDPLWIDAGSPWFGPEYMTDWRFYPSLISLGSAHGDRILVIGGTPAIQPFGTGTEPLQTQPPSVMTWDPPFTSAEDPANPPAHPSPLPFESYPRVFLLSDSRILSAGDVQACSDPFRDPDEVPGGTNGPAERNSANTFPGTCQIFTMPQSGSTGPVTVAAAAPLFDASSPNSPLPPSMGATGLAYGDLNYGSAVLLHCRPESGGSDRVLVFGGSEGIPAGSPFNSLGVTYPLKVHDRVMEFVNEGSTGSWVVGTPMNVPRTHLNAVVLPTRRIFLVGGTWDDHLTDSNLLWQPVPIAELYDPGELADLSATTTYAALPQNGLGSPPAAFPWTPRVYHQVAVLLPDGRVLVAGGENVPGNHHPFGGADLASSAHTAEIYSPPYLFHGFRPTINRAPDRITYSLPFTVDVSCTVSGVIDRFVLMRPGAVTHHFDNDQRYIELDFEQKGPQEYTVHAPSANLSPSGHYMLFAIFNDTANRVPSVAHWIHLK